MPAKWARVACSASSRSKSWFSGSARRWSLDPGEERIKSEFQGVKCTMLPMHSILRIDEVKKQGTAKISAFEGSNVAQFPMSMYHARRQRPGPKK